MLKLEGKINKQQVNINKIDVKDECVADEDLEALIEEVVRASNRGVSAAKNVSSEPNWSFGQSVFFSSTVVTTIGNTTCSSIQSIAFS